MKKLEFRKNAYGKLVSLPVVIYPLKKDGTRDNNPMFINPIGTESSQEEVLARIQSQNPNSKFELA